MNKQIKELLVMLVLSFAITGIAGADTSMGSSDTQSLWESLDVDKDGFLSKQEAGVSAVVTDSWNNIDANKDEKISVAEFTQYFAKK